MSGDHALSSTYLCLWLRLGHGEMHHRQMNIGPNWCTVHWCTVHWCLPLQFVGQPTSHHVSAKHIEQYEKNMKDYLKTVKELWPSQHFHPNHINALLIGKYLHLYGPVQGWWMFPFKRVIGDLQRSSTNNKLGE